MNYINIIIACAFIGFGSSGNAENQVQEGFISVPKPERGVLSSVFIPLLHGNGYFWPTDVPAILYGPGREGAFRAMCSPFYAISSETEDREKDLNLISIYNIKIDLRKRAGESGGSLIIDLSKAKKPEGAEIELADVVQEALACIRIAHTPKFLPNVEIKIVGGGGKIDWSRFEGPLWQNRE